MGATGWKLTAIMIALGVFMVLLIVVWVLLSNPPTKWVDRLGDKRDRET